MISVDVGRTTTALVPTAVEADYVQGSSLVMHTIRFHG